MHTAPTQQWKFGSLQFCYIDAFFPEEVQWSCLFPPLIDEFNEIFYWESLMRSE